MIASSLSFSISVRPSTPYFLLLVDLFVIPRNGFISNCPLCDRLWSARGPLELFLWLPALLQILGRYVLRSTLKVDAVLQIMAVQMFHQHWSVESSKEETHRRISRYYTNSVNPPYSTRCLLRQKEKAHNRIVRSQLPLRPAQRREWRTKRSFDFVASVTSRQ